MKKNLCFLLLMALMAGFHIAKAQCDADTAFFYLPQNEFNS